MSYSEFEFLTTDELERAWLMSILDDYGFNGYEETQDALKAFVTEGKLIESQLQKILEDNELGHIQYSLCLLEDKNWNEEWEKNFEPVIIAQRVGIRAPFHQPLKTDIEIIIEPKMSFGTGHHGTTAAMVELMLKSNVSGKNVLDIGCGTGILAIIAEKLKAIKITAVDNDEWAYKNCLENIARNNCVKVESLFGNGNKLEGMKFDLILANINRAVIMENLATWVNWLNSGALLLISGILLNDENGLLALAGELHLKLNGRIVQNEWIALSFIRS